MQIYVNFLLEKKFFIHSAPDNRRFDGNLKPKCLSEGFVAFPSSTTKRESDRKKVEKWILWVFMTFSKISSAHLIYCLAFKCIHRRKQVGPLTSLTCHSEFLWQFMVKRFLRDSGWRVIKNAIKKREYLFNPWNVNLPLAYANKSSKADESTIFKSIFPPTLQNGVFYVTSSRSSNRFKVTLRCTGTSEMYKMSFN